jgi:hypothetical protein
VRVKQAWPLGCFAACEKNPRLAWNVSDPLQALLTNAQGNIVRHEHWRREFTFGQALARIRGGLIQERGGFNA